MSIKKIKIGIALLIAVFAVKSCKKDKITLLKNNNVITPSNYASFAQFRKSFKPLTQSFSINATNGGFIRGDRGYTFRIKPNSLRLQNGSLASGNVSIKLTEVTNVHEMLATGAFTQANNGILGSAAMFNLTISQNGAPITIDPQLPIAAEVMTDPSADLSNIQVFSGSESSDNFSSDSISNDTTIKWDLRDSVPSSGGNNINYDSLRQVYDSIQKEYNTRRCIKFDLYFTSWCNLDAYFNDPNGAKIRVKYDNVTEDLDTRVFMYLKQGYLNGFYELTYEGFSKEFTSTYYNLPVGWNIKIILVTNTKDKQIKYQVKDIINATSTVHECNSLSDISDADLEAFFKSLK